MSGRLSRHLVTVCVAAGATLGLVALPGCGGSENCIILANGGNKLCGDDARVWCDTTPPGCRRSSDRR
jgi:hypothetical protein